MNFLSHSISEPPLSPVFDTLLPFLSKNEDNVFNPGILAYNEEKSPHLLSHQGFKSFQLISESPMMISGGNTPNLDVPRSSTFLLIVVYVVFQDSPDVLKTSRAGGFVLQSRRVNLLIAKIEALKDNPTPSSDFVTKSSSTSLNFFLEETNTFDNSIPESETFCFDLDENSIGSTTTRSDYSLPDYEAFYFDDDHIEDKSSGSTTTHSDISLSKYDSFIFDLSNDPFPPADRSDFYHEEFADELAHIISPPEYECFYFKIEPDPGELTSIVDPEIRENISSTTNVNYHSRMPNLISLLMLYGSFLLYSRIPFLLYIFSPPGMKKPFLTPASPFIILLCRVYLIGVELS
ncbi:hypothetical protein Tco_0969490 [Tanacetum coccineum]